MIQLRDPRQLGAQLVQDVRDLIEQQHLDERTAFTALLVLCTEHGAKLGLPRAGFARLVTAAYDVEIDSLQE